jgi:pimeloyl-ACP methyl ester carboxylesterase
MPIRKDSILWNLATFTKLNNFIDMFLSFRDGKIHYTDNGKGEVIVLLHGYLETSEIFRSFGAKLAVNYRVICVDLPGHGQSDIYGEVHTMEFMAEAVKEVLDYSGITKVFMTGHSLGGYVSLAFLELFPKYLKGYCLFHSHPLADSPEAINNRNREINLVQKGMKDLMYPGNVTKMFASSNVELFHESIQRSKDLSSSIPGEGIVSVLKGMISRPSRLDLMEKGIVPCLWILGSMDNYIPCDAIQEKVKLPSNATLVILKKSGHIGFVEEEEMSVKAIIEFVKKHF